MTTPLPRGFLEEAETALGQGRLATDALTLESYARDNTGLRHLPGGVFLAENGHEVAALLTLCHHFRVPVTPRGAGTGNVGGALPVRGGVVLSTQRMNRIVEINPEDRLAVVEPGVVNADLQAALRPHGLFWPPDPSSARICSVGGNLAMCSAGPNAVRYGVTRDWVLGLRAVLADGRFFHSGGRTSKGVVGLDLTRLLIGSEGTLAVVVEATLRLAPRPGASRLLRAVYGDVESAARAVSAITNLGDPPSAVEFMDGAALDLLRRGRAVSVAAAGRALLLVEVSGDSREVDGLATRAREILAQFQPLEVLQAADAAESARIWQARAALSPALKKLAPHRINEDVVVPLSRLPALIHGLETISRESGIPIVNFGHAGNGNIHVNLLTSLSVQELLPVLRQVFQLVRDLDGSLSGEHGVGIQKRPFVTMELDPVSIELQQAIKAVFDPRGILNPDKVFPV